jgi:putative oxygen-independent coproporphyrinogen III oxidase
MSNGANHNRPNRETDSVGRLCQTPESRTASAAADALQFSRKLIQQVRHIYVHIPFCARICPYCAFYKDLLDRSQTSRLCEALLRELELHESRRRTGDRRFLFRPSTIYFGGGTPTALNIAQLELLLRGFHETLDLSRLVEWTIEANPGSVSARKAALLKKFGVKRISLGVQSWDDELLNLLGREHNAHQAEESFRILRDAGFININVDLMFGLPGQTIDQWRATLEKTIALQPQHISTYCLTYEEDTEFFVRHARGEFLQDADADAEFFELTMAMLEYAGYDHYEISNYARPGFESVHNHAYWLGKDYLGIGPSAVSTIGLQRWQNVCDYRAYIDRVLSSRSPRESSESLTDEMKRTERIALSLRTRDGVSAAELKDFGAETDELLALGLLRQSNGNFVLTSKGKALTDSVAEVFL